MTIGTDTGLQRERTMLAWRRTVLAVVVGSALALRLLPPVVGAWSTAVGVAGLLSSVALWSAVRRRSASIDRAVDTLGPLPGAALLAAVAAMATVGAALGVLVVVAG